MRVKRRSDRETFMIFSTLVPLVVSDLFRASLRSFVFRQPFLMLGNYRGIFDPVFASQQVAVVPGIVGFTVVELFGAILVTDVAPVAGADGVVATPLSHKCRTVSTWFGGLSTGGQGFGHQAGHRR